jgi:hypothetical protein
MSRSIFENARQGGSFEEPQVFFLATKFQRYLNFPYVFQSSLAANFNMISSTPDAPCYYCKFPEFQFADRRNMKVKEYKQNGNGFLIVAVCLTIITAVCLSS